jgi:2-dehydropantoate 2-reductase
VLGALVFGRYPEAGSGESDPVAERIAADLAGARMISELVARPQRWKYAKLLRNLANAIEAVGGSARNDEAEQAVYLDQLVWNEIPDAPRHGGSSWQSLARGAGSIEPAYLNGEIVLLGRLHGIRTPVNTLLLRLAESAAASGTMPGSVTPAEMLMMVDDESSEVSAVP